jgi:predicted nucleotide-binding protein (sugar kinase/HSP70/actin superfamily)
MHPGFVAGTPFRIKMLWGIAMIDALDTMVRRLKPYERVPGRSQEIYDRWSVKVVEAAAKSYRKGLRLLPEAIAEFNTVEIDASVRKPRVGVLGEILMKYHPGANGYVERYLEEHGMEVARPGMLDFFRRDELRRIDMVKRGLIQHPLKNLLIGEVSEALYGYAARRVEACMRKFRWYEHHADCYEMADLLDGIVDKTYDTGEGWLIPAEIMSLAPTGVNSFVIVQPFACLANHISGRGLTKSVKQRHPGIQILSLDYDPDTSFANIENRLQMLIINARSLEKSREPLSN